MQWSDSEWQEKFRAWMMPSVETLLDTVVWSLVPNWFTVTEAAAPELTLLFVPVVNKVVPATLWRVAISPEPVLKTLTPALFEASTWLEIPFAQKGTRSACPLLMLAQANFTNQGLGVINRSIINWSAVALRDWCCWNADGTEDCQMKYDPDWLHLYRCKHRQEGLSAKNRRFKRGSFALYRHQPHDLKAKGCLNWSLFATSSGNPETLVAVTSLYYTWVTNCSK